MDQQIDLFDSCW